MGSPSFFYDFKKVPSNQIVKQIWKLDGIEKIVRLAAEEDSRQRKDTGGIKKRGKAGYIAGPQPR